MFASWPTKKGYAQFLFHNILVPIALLTATLLLAGCEEATPVDDKGRLRVDSVPQGARIYLDGRATGRLTPATFDVSPGSHTVRLTRDGMLDWGPRTITIAAGENETLHVVLSPVPVSPEFDCDNWNTLEFFSVATIESVTACIRAGADVNARDDARGATPLHWAAAANDKPVIIATLVSAGAAVNARDHDLGGTPLHWAAAATDTPAIIRALAAVGAEVDARDDNLGMTPLHWTALADNSPGVVRALVSVGADANARDDNGNPPLYYAEDPAVIAALQEAGAVALADTLSVLVDPNAAAGEPTHIVAGDNGSLQFWSNGALLSESLLNSADGTTRIRARHDAQTGAPQTVLNEVTGDYIELRENRPGRVDLWFYDSAGRYQSGIAVVERSGSFFYGEITGLPKYSGKQIIGQLGYLNSSQTGSFALTSEVDDDIAQLQAFPADLLGFLDTRSGLRAASSGITLRKTLVTGGLALVAGGLALSLAPAYATAGATMALLGYFVTGDIAKGIRDNFADTESEFGKASANLVADWLADEDAPAPLHWVRNAVDRVKQGATEFKNRIVDEVESLQDWVSGGETWERMRASWPSSSDAPPDISSSLSGTVVFQDNNTLQLRGDIDNTGEFNVSSDDDALTIEGSVDSTGSVSGTFTNNSNSGTITSGSIEDLGSCSVSRGSGGQGTFSYSHFVGTGMGTANFYYNAYSIPDAFTVTTSSGTKFTTQGLVSGSNSVDISINDEPVVFINVSAPRSGTQWEYTLGCLQ